MKAPSVKLPRSLKLSCKLSDEQIAEIPELYSQGFTLKDLAKMYHISPAGVRRWTMSPDERKELDKINRENYPKVNDKKRRKQVKDCANRRKKLLPEEYREFERIRSAIFRENNPDGVREKQKKWLEKNKGYHKKYSIKWKKENPDYFKEYYNKNK